MTIVYLHWTTHRSKHRCPIKTNNHITSAHYLTPHGPILTQSWNWTSLWNFLKYLHAYNLGGGPSNAWKVHALLGRCLVVIKNWYVVFSLCKQMFFHDLRMLSRATYACYLTETTLIKHHPVWPVSCTLFIIEP